MKSIAAAQFPYAWLTIVGLFLFFTVFIGVVFFAFQRKRKSHFEKLAQLPLSE